MTLSQRRVVVTGVGLISPLGNSTNELWEALSNSRSGVERYASVPAECYANPYGAEARGFSGEIDDFGALEGDLKKAIRKGLKLMCREIAMGVASAQLALQNGGLKSGVYDPDRTGVSFGADYIMSPPEEFESAVRKCVAGGRQPEITSWGAEGIPEVQPLWLLKYLPNMPASHIAIYNDFRGPSNSITQREASFNLAVGEAYAAIQRDHADIVLAGATGSRVNSVRTTHATLQEQIASGNDPQQLSRPFELNRNGMVLGEGAAALVVESLDNARKRGASILGEILGHGSSAVISPRGLADWRAAVRNAIRLALRSANLTPDEVGHVHAHGLSTVQMDAQEAAGILDVFGERSESVPVVAAKSFFGNLGGGGGGVELIASLLALGHQHLFPTLNYDVPDPACPLRMSREYGLPSGASCVNLNITPQGQVSVLVVRRLE